MFKCLVTNFQVFWDFLFDFLTPYFWGTIIFSFLIHSLCSLVPWIRQDKSFNFLWTPWDLASFELLNVHPIFERNVFPRNFLKRNRTLDTLCHPLPKFQNKIVTWMYFFWFLLCIRAKNQNKVKSHYLTQVSFF